MRGRSICHACSSTRNHPTGSSRPKLAMLGAKFYRFIAPLAPRTGSSTVRICSRWLYHFLSYYWTLSWTVHGLSRPFSYLVQQHGLVLVCVFLYYLVFLLISLYLLLLFNFILYFDSLFGILDQVGSIAISLCWVVVNLTVVLHTFQTLLVNVLMYRFLSNQIIIMEY